MESLPNPAHPALFVVSNAPPHTESPGTLPPPGAHRARVVVGRVPPPGSIKARWETSQPNALCWHCCHPVGNRVAVPLAVAYDQRLDSFAIEGLFCGWGCSKAYGRDTMARKMVCYDSGVQTLFKRRCLGKQAGREAWETASAPPRSMLQGFGGPLTIEEFRAVGPSVPTYAELPQRMVLRAQVVEEHRENERRAAGVQRALTRDVASTSVAFKDARASTTMLKTRRSGAGSAGDINCAAARATQTMLAAAAAAAPTKLHATKKPVGLDAFLKK